MGNISALTASAAVANWQCRRVCASAWHHEGCVVLCLFHAIEVTVLQTALEYAVYVLNPLYFVSQLLSPPKFKLMSNPRVQFLLHYSTTATRCGVLAGSRVRSVCSVYDG